MSDLLEFAEAKETASPFIRVEGPEYTRQQFTIPRPALQFHHFLVQPADVVIALD